MLENIFFTFENAFANTIACYHQVKCHNSGLQAFSDNVF